MNPISRAILRLEVSLSPWDDWFMLIILHEPSELSIFEMSSIIEVLESQVLSSIYGY